MSAGKGDKIRPHNKSKYNKNFDNIKWSKEKREPTKTVKGKLVFVYKSE